MALYMMIFMGGTPLGSPIVGWVGEAFGARWTLIGGGAMTILGTLLAVALFSRRQGLNTPRPGGRRASASPSPGAACCSAPPRTELGQVTPPAQGRLANHGWCRSM